MDFKLFGGITLGLTIGGGLAYLYHRKVLSDHDNTLKRKYTTQIDSLGAECEKLRTENASRVSEYINAINVYNGAVNTYKKITDPDLLADISIITDDGLKNGCLDAVSAIRANIDRLISQAFNDLTDKDVIETVIDSFTTDTDISLDMIEKFMKLYQDTQLDEDDDDDDDDDDVSPNTTISPKRVILTGVGCDPIVFDADPDDGFEVLDGSDVDNNDYCIVAQNIPQLYRILFDSIHKQLSEHYVAKIDPDAFDMILDDMVITVSLSFVTETDAVITAVNAVVPFELFGLESGHEFKIYSIKEGEINNNDVIRYFRNSSSSSNIQDGEESILNSSRQTKEVTNTPVNSTIDLTKIDVSLSDQNIQFIIDNIGYSRDALKSFFGKLGVLFKVNPEAASSIKDVFADILREIHVEKSMNKLTEDERLRIANSIKTLITNMKKHYGAEIKAYSQSI